MSECKWTPAGDGTVTSELGALRLAVQTVGGLPRFLVRSGSAPVSDTGAALLASGTSTSVSAAMTAAEAAAARLRFLAGVKCEATP